MININSDAMTDLGCSVASGVVAEYFVNNKIKDKKLYINGLTLYRNFTGCLEGTSYDKIAEFKASRSLADIYQLFIDDTMVLLESLFSQNIDTQIYIPNYSKILKEWGNPVQASKLKGLRHEIVASEKGAMELLKKEFPVIVKEIKYTLPYSKDMYIMTHIGLDLLSFNYLQKVNLIESFTGEVKTFSKWYSKFSKLGNNDMSIMPFNSLIYRILGDGVIIKPDDIKTRKFVYEVAVESKWDSRKAIPNILLNIKSKSPGIFIVIQKLISKLF